MKARLAKGFAAASEVEDLTSIVVYDDFGNPIVVIHRQNEGEIVQYHAGMADFDKVLGSLGIGLNATCKLIRLNKGA
jgi:hypothetical protein